jgi:hypothetical protein
LSERRHRVRPDESGFEGDDSSGVIRELNVILDVVVASGEWRRLGRRRLTRFRMSPEG